MRWIFVCAAILFLVAGSHPDQPGDSEPFHQSMEIFPLVEEHVHGPGIVELPNGDLLACWFQGSGERWADDVRIMGARLPKNGDQWSEPFVMAEYPGFPDINPVLFIDPHERLWLIWYTVIANQWETSLPRYKISTNFMQAEGPPEWDWQEIIIIRHDVTERGIQPGDRFVASVEEQIADYTSYLESIGALVDNDESDRRTQAAWEARADRVISLAKGENMLRAGHLYREDGSYEAVELGYPHFRRLGWQTQNKPVVLEGERMILPLYSDGFSFSLMAITDDWGETWQFSSPIVGAGNIQAAIAEKQDGTLVAYMRDNGPPPKRLHMSSSSDRGETWSPVRYSELPNPGSGPDIVTLNNGNWLLVYNDLESGRYSLAVSISEDDGETWQWTRHLELDDRDPAVATRSHYPAVVQGADGAIHVTYSFHHNDRDSAEPHKTIKYARFNEAWVRNGEQETATP